MTENNMDLHYKDPTINAVCSENQTEPINTLFGQSVEILMLKQTVQTIWAYS
jgi:hypothetical protein